MFKRLGVLMLAVLMAFSVASFAAGPMLGVNIVPTTGAAAQMMFGYDFNDFNLEVTKANLTTLTGPWTVGGLWTPEEENGFGYRAGVSLRFTYTALNTFVYRTFVFQLGASKTWGPIQLYGELDFQPAGVLAIVPVVGVNFLFGDLVSGKAGI